ncbi:tRNA glutamyl-Q(34) synthetase GluQRS [Hydromonas duriensis]|uniref:Glutamyl-Q tRNA(Asp) synthetase n=1 Tax=Hydromonas duriensis TaxID=1527608 RepID=A0A4R6Y5W3_9BURK|nr:tRNA glutamyl-Q(34) synthetase GluQRS [Hydromonas duriensis]TDR30911.1 glutamyl-Q tRNA(Asp) synthetase [Hydromonas duriensis]
MRKSTNNTPIECAPNLLTPDSWLARAWHSAQRHRQHPNTSPYIGRFAPSPSGLLHQGSLIAALASYLHARWHAGTWLVRMEDVDVSRCTRAYGLAQLQLLMDLGFEFDNNVMWQSERNAAYQAAFAQLQAQGRIYPCGCSRKEIADSRIALNTTATYSGACRHGMTDGKAIRSWRFRVDDEVIRWNDENGDSHMEAIAQSVGDFVLKRETPQGGEWAYQLAVVVDDAAQGVTHVVRGADLLDSTARQIALQQALNLPTPQYNHFPLLLNPQGEKISKREQAPALHALDGLSALQHAWQFLGGTYFECHDVPSFWSSVLPNATF